MGSKIGIVFAFLLSVAAAGGSYYLYQGWVEERTVRASVEAKYDEAQDEMSTVQSEKEQLQAKSEEYRSKAEAMQAQLEKLKTDQSRIDSEKSALENQLKSHQGMIADLQKQVGDLEKKAKEAQAACGVTPADLQTNVLSTPQPFDSTAVAAESAPAAASLGTGETPLVFQPVTSSGSTVSAVSPAVSASSAVPSEVANSVPAVTEIPVPGVSPAVPAENVQSQETATAVGAVSTAKILTVNRKFNFVVINQGLQNGLKMGDKLKVLKQGKEIGTIQVEKLYEKFSAATLIEEDPKQQAAEGDEIRKI